MKMISRIMILLSGTAALSFMPANDLCKRWDKNVKLTWGDFTGIVPVNPQHGAITHAGINYTSSFINDTLNLDIIACFTKNQSWVDVEKESDYALDHEQRHFDIAEINARKFRQYALKWDGKYNITTYLSDGSDIFFKSMNDMQTLYDKETRHSQNKPFQQKWDKKIDSLLNVYSAYENPLVKLPRHK